MVSIRFYLHTPKKKKSPIYVRVHVNGKALPGASIQESVACDGINEKGKAVPSEWNHEEQKVRKTNSWHEVINKKIKRIELAIGTTFREMLEQGQEPTSEDVRRIINPNRVAAKKGEPVLVREYYEAWGAWYISKKNRGNKTEEKKGKDYVRGFKQIVDKVHLFRPKAKLRDFLMNFNQPLKEGLIEEFDDWVADKYDLQDTTVSRYHKLFRVLFKYAGMPWDWLSVDSVNSNERFALEWEEVLKLATHNYSSLKVQKTAHTSVMVIQMALRWGDFSKIRNGHMANLNSFQHGEVMVLNKNQNKTGLPIYVPLPALSTQLYNQYKEVPLEFKQRDKFSEALKEAAKEAGLNRVVRLTKTFGGHVHEYFKPVHEVLSPHILRHTGATLIDAITRGRDKFLVKALLGHTVNDATSSYVHANPIVAVDDLLDAWAKIQGRVDV